MTVMTLQVSRGSGFDRHVQGYSAKRGRPMRSRKGHGMATRMSSSVSDSPMATWVWARFASSIRCAGALFSLGVNARHFASAGFEAKFQALMQGKITDLTLTEVNIYGPRNTSDHRDDKALIALFRKA
mgnify:CR=1 FL=1